MTGRTPDNSLSLESAYRLVKAVGWLSGVFIQLLIRRINDYTMSSMIVKTERTREFQIIVRCMTLRTICAPSWVEVRMLRLRGEVHGVGHQDRRALPADILRAEFALHMHPAILG